VRRTVGADVDAIDDPAQLDVAPRRGHGGRRDLLVREPGRRLGERHPELGLERARPPDARAVDLERDEVRREGEDRPQRDRGAGQLAALALEDLGRFAAQEIERAVGVRGDERPLGRTARLQPGLHDPVREVTQGERRERRCERLRPAQSQCAREQEAVRAFAVALHPRVAELGRRPDRGRGDRLRLGAERDFGPRERRRVEQSPARQGRVVRLDRHGRRRHQQPLHERRGQRFLRGPLARPGHRHARRDVQ